MQSIVDNISLASEGKKNITWYKEQMTVLANFNKRYLETKPFKGMRILVCMHCEPKGVLRTEALIAGGASEVVFIGNLGSTKPESAAYLASLSRVCVLAKKNDTLEDLNNYVEMALQKPADLFLDNGASLMQCYAKLKPKWNPIGAIEETRSGQLLLEKNNIAPCFPLLVIDDSPVKRLIENEAGVGQSVVDGFMRATSMVVGGKNILVVGYGYCGSGISQRFRALGARTMVYDLDPIKRLKARIEGHETGRLDLLLQKADAIVTVTGCFDIIGMSEIEHMQNKAILFNAGHYNMEIDVSGMKHSAREYIAINDNITKYSFGDKDIYLLQQGNPLNLSAASGNPIEIMEVGYALQLLSLEEIIDGKLENGILPLTKEINLRACELCLEAWEYSQSNAK